MQQVEKEPHVILHLEGFFAPDEALAGPAVGGLLPLAQPATASELNLEIANLDALQANELGQDPNVLIAPRMPLKLIEPIPHDGSATESTEPTVITWGVQEVGAVSSPFDGEGITVGVLDTGIDPFHSGFAGVELIRKNFTQDSDDDINGHGTHVAGTIFGQPEDGFRYSVAPGVKRAVIGKVLGRGGGGSDHLFHAIKWAVDEGAIVINMSLGIDFPGYVDYWVSQGYPVEQVTSMALKAYRDNIRVFDSLVQMYRQLAALQAGSALIVAAAGNESERFGSPPFTIDVAPPAAANGVVAVGALTPPNAMDGAFGIAPFSNINPVVCGPGVDVWSAKSGGGYTRFSGTSMASPHVAGVAALWAQKQQEGGSINLEDIRANLIGHTTTDRLPFGRVDIGAGLIQAPSA